VAPKTTRIFLAAIAKELISQLCGGFDEIDNRFENLDEIDLMSPMTLFESCWRLKEVV